MKIDMNDPDLPVFQMDRTDRSADWPKGAAGLPYYEEGMTIDEFIVVILGRGDTLENFKTTFGYLAAVGGQSAGPVPDWIDEL